MEKIESPERPAIAPAVDLKKSPAGREPFEPVYRRQTSQYPESRADHWIFRAFDPNDVPDPGPFM